MLNSLQPKIIDAQISSPQCVTILKTGNILVCEYEAIHVLDKDFKLIRKVDNINDVSLYCWVSTSKNNEDKMFICDCASHSVKMVDLDFNFIRQFGTGVAGNGLNQLNYPDDSCFYKNFLYVCDTDNSRIVKLTENLDYVEAFDLGYSPVNIRIYNETVCIEVDFRQGTNFHDLNTFALKFEYPNESGTIAVFDPFFFVLKRDLTKLSCFDENGQLLKSIQLDNLLNKGLQVYDHTTTLVNNGKFLLFSNNKIVIID